jgi:nucleoside-diphosphate-sugar epimerase
MSDSRNHTVNLLDRQQVDRLMERVQPTHLLHLAWYAEHGKFWTSPLNLDWVAASLGLFQSFVNNGGQRAVFAGSCAEYDWHHAGALSETSVANPNTLYGVCKNSLRQIVEKFADQSSVSLAWGRVFFLYGPGEHPNRLVPSILNPLLTNQPAIVRSGGHLRNLMHVEDVARAFVHILRSSAAGPVNIAGSEAVSLGEVAGMLGEMTGKPHLLKIEHAEGTPQNPRVLVADTGKLRSLGFTEKYSLRQGLLTLQNQQERL